MNYKGSRFLIKAKKGYRKKVDDRNISSCHEYCYRNDDYSYTYFVMNILLDIYKLCKNKSFSSGFLSSICNTTDTLCQYLSIINFTPGRETGLKGVDAPGRRHMETKVSIVCSRAALCYLILRPCLYLYLEIKCGLKTSMWSS